MLVYTYLEAILLSADELLVAAQGYRRFALYRRRYSGISLLVTLGTLADIEVVQECGFRIFLQLPMALMEPTMPKQFPMGVDADCFRSVLLFVCACFLCLHN